MDIDVCSNVAADEWRELLGSDPTSTFFHTLEWARVIESTIPRWSRLYLTARHGGRLVGALPLMVRRVRGAVVLASMPFGTYGGVLIGGEDRNTIAAALFQRFREMACAPRVAYAEVVDFPSRIALATPNGIAPRMIEAHVLDLRPGYKALLRRFTPANRNKIRKAKRCGVVVRRVTSVTDFLDYHSMLAACYSRWKLPLRLPKAFFSELSKIGEPHVEMWLADRDGRAVAGLLNFHHDGTVMNWGSVSLPSGRPSAVHNILHATAIEDAVRSGASTYNFGSNPGLPGVTAFKASFGTRPLCYRAYRSEKLWYRILRGRSKSVPAV